MSEFHKTPKQNEATVVLGSTKYAALFGGSRSGKTFIIIHSIIVRACKEKSRHAVVRLNFNAVKRSVWQDTFPKVLRLCFPNIKVTLNKTDFIAEFSNGSQIYFAGLDDGARTEKILGLEFSTIYFNEASQIDYSSVQIALTRLAEKNGLKKRVWFDFNPPKKSHWSYYLFIKKLDPVDDVPLANADEYSSLLMNPSDNLDNIDEDYIKMLEAMPEKDRNRFLLGLFNDESDGQVYYAFRRDEHIKETKIQPGTLFTGHDFNVNPMTMLVAQLVGGVFYIHDELWLENSDTYRMCDEAKKRGYIGRAIPDSTGANRKTSGKSDFQIMREAGFTIESTHNPFVMDRVNNVNRLLTAGKIVISPKCKKLINDLEKVSWKSNKLDAGPEGKLTHISDCLGYICWKLDPISSMPAKVTQQLIR